MEPLNSSTSKTVYMFMKHSHEGHSLFGFDVVMPPKEDGDWVVKPPVALHYFQRTGMACGKLGSKLYFLGGYLPVGKFKTSYQYPSDVQVFDPTVPAKLTQVRPMNSGKIDPVAFELNGKLYVLGGSSPEAHDIKLFEEYDPTTERWKVLDGPVEIEGYYFYWCSCYVVNSSRVIFQGSFPCTLFTFNPTTLNWSKLNVSGDWSFGSDPVFVDYSFYGAGSGVAYYKAGPFPESVLEDDDVIAVRNLADECVFQPFCDRDIDSMPYLIMDASPTICHLGNRLFCVVETASVSSFPLFDDYRRKFNIFIVKDLPQDAGSCEMKCLHAAKFTTTAEFPNFGCFRSCHAISNERYQENSLEESQSEIWTNTSLEAARGVIGGHIYELGSQRPALCDVPTDAGYNNNNQELLLYLRDMRAEIRKSVDVLKEEIQELRQEVSAIKKEKCSL